MPPPMLPRPDNGTRRGEGEDSVFYYRDLQMCWNIQSLGWPLYSFPIIMLFATPLSLSLGSVTSRQGQTAVKVNPQIMQLARLP